MSRVETFVGIGVVILVAIFARRMAVDLIGPGTPLFQLAANAQFGDAGGQEWAMQLYENAAVWVPWILVATAVVAGLYREFTRQNVTVQSARRGR